MTIQFPAVTLLEYSYRIGYHECAFFGIRHPNNDQYACREIWSLAQRQEIERALYEAQDMIEQVTRFHLVPKWEVAEEHDFKKLVALNWMYLISMGVIDDTLIAGSVDIDHTTDPAVLDDVVGVTCALDDIHVMFEGTDVEIIPTKKELVAGTLSIEIPRCRLVDPTYWDNPSNGWDYNDVATWGATHVDIRCITNDDTDQMTLYRRTPCTCNNTLGDGCAYITNNRLSFLNLRPNATTCHCGCWIRAKLNYLSGRAAPTSQDEDMIIRLAHSTLPNEPCGCQVTKRMWARDQNIPQVLTRERLNNPFGMSDGAWLAWRYANNIKIMRGSMWV
jgi:hypothetical protein